MEFSIFSLFLFLSLSLARSLARSFCLSFAVLLVRSLSLFLSLSLATSLLSRCRRARSCRFSLVSSFLPSSAFSVSSLLAAVRIGRLLDRSVSSCVRDHCFNQGYCLYERVNERSRGHRARPPFTTVSFVFSLSFFLSSSSHLRLSRSPSLSLFVYPARTHQTHTVLSKIRQRRAGATRSCHCCNCLVFARSSINTFL